MENAEGNIVHEAGAFYVWRDGDVMTVYRNGTTHAVADGSYRDYSLAVTRCNYLAKREAERKSQP